MSCAHCPLLLLSVKFFSRIVASLSKDKQVTTLLCAMFNRIFIIYAYYFVMTKVWCIYYKNETILLNNTSCCPLLWPSLTSSQKSPSWWSVLPWFGLLTLGFCLLVLLWLGTLKAYLIWQCKWEHIQRVLVDGCCNCHHVYTWSAGNNCTTTMHLFRQRKWGII